MTSTALNTILAFFLSCALASIERSSAVHTDRRSHMFTHAGWGTRRNGGNGTPHFTLHTFHTQVQLGHYLWADVLIYSFKAEVIAAMAAMALHTILPGVPFALPRPIVHTAPNMTGDAVVPLPSLLRKYAREWTGGDGAFYQGVPYNKLALLHDRRCCRAAAIAIEKVCTRMDRWGRSVFSGCF